MKTTMPRRRSLRTGRSRLASVCLPLTAACWVAAGTVQAADPLEQRIKLDISANTPLDEALLKWSATAHVEIMMSAESMVRQRTHGIHGEARADAALTVLLEGTGLRYTVDNHIVHVIQDTSVLRTNANQDGQTPLAAARTPPAASSESTAKQGPDAMQEVLVTAQKREERLGDVPISINVVTADDISQRSLVGAEDYLRGMPGVNQMAGYYGDTIVIRGIETSPGYLENFASGSPVATYFGETPTSTSAGMAGGSNIDLKLADVTRVEVLRGPQGTAFGDASLGGAVRVIPTEPDPNRFAGRFSGGYSKTADTGGNNDSFEGVVNIPLIDSVLAVRGVGYTYFDSGFVRNVAASDPKFAAYSAQVGQQVLDVDHVGNRTVNGGRVAALFQPTSDLKFTATYLRQTTEVDGQPHSGTSDNSTAPFATLGPYEQALPVLAPEQFVRGQKLGLLLTDIHLSNATLQYNLGWADLLATGSYIDSSSTSVTQLQLAGFPAQRGVGPHHETDGEVRLVSKLNGAWDFIAGLYYQKTDDNVLFDYWWYQSPAVELASFGTSNPYMGNYFDQRDLRQRAAYGEVSWKFFDGFTLTGGTRAYRYDRSDDVITTGPIFGDQNSPSTARASGTSWRGNLSYKPNEGTLIYATWSEGFRLGKPQPGLPQSLCGDPNGIVKGTEGTTNVSIASTRVVNSDTIVNYELGTKLSLLDRRLSLSADVYRMNWRGLPISVNAPPPVDGGCALTYVANAGKAKSQGIEFQATYYLMPALKADVGASFVDATLTQDVPSITAVAGDRLPGSPKVNGSFALQYTVPVAEHDAWVRAETTYVGTFYGDLQQTVQTKAGGYVTVGASGGITINPHLVLKLDLTNLTNADKFIFRNFTDTGPDYGYRLRPRTVGIQLESNF